MIFPDKIPYGGFKIGVMDVFLIFHPQDNFILTGF